MPVIATPVSTAAAAPVVTLTARGISVCKAATPAIVVTDLIDVPAVNVSDPDAVGVCEAAMLFATSV